MSKRKTIIELQSKPENKAVRRIIEKTKPVEFAPISSLNSEPRLGSSAPQNGKNFPEIESQLKSDENLETSAARKLRSGVQTTQDAHEVDESVEISASNNRSLVSEDTRNAGFEKAETSSLPLPQSSASQIERLRIFQTSTPVTRTTTKFQKAAIVVRGENGKQLVELLWRDQMNEKTRDIWDFLCKKFVQAAELDTSEVLIRKRDILEGSGVKSDRTFISAIYTLEDMGLIQVKRLSGNKEGNSYILMQEGKEEIDAYRNYSV